MKNILKNKRGDIPIVILVLGVVAICMMAIFSFVIENNNLKGGKDSLGVGAIEKLNSDVEKFEFYVNAGESREEAAKRIDGASIEDGKLIIKRDSEIVSVIYEKKLDETSEKDSEENKKI